jgi:N-acetylneuraminate synthase/N,N'-diacetyllegionaminate synthase
MNMGSRSSSERTIEVDNRPIGPGHPCFVIAEAGVNHDGDPGKASALVEAAAQAGADCVKFQTFRAADVAVAAAPKAAYQLRTTDRGESQLEMLARLELPEEALPRLMAQCRARGLAFLSTPYGKADVDLLHRLGVPALKLASIHMAEPAFLAYAAATGLPLVVSTGMADLGEIDRGVRAVRDAGNRDLVLLQCTTNYPSPVEEANLRTIPAMARAFGTPVGFSDHTTGEVCAIAAVALGACVIEKHLTLDRSAPGPDHAASLEPYEMAAFVAKLRNAERALGSAVKRPTASEIGNRAAMRRSLVAIRDIPAGARVEEAALGFLRPGDGIPAADLDRVAGAAARTPIACGTKLRWSMLELDD